MINLIDTWHITPKKVVSDTEFVNSPKWRQFWARYNISPVPTGSFTPWPNRAERVVQIVKRIITMALQTGAYDNPSYLTRQQIVLGQTTAGANGTSLITSLSPTSGVRVRNASAIVVTAGIREVAPYLTPADSN